MLSCNIINNIFSLELILVITLLIKSNGLLANYTVISMIINYIHTLYHLLLILINVTYQNMIFKNSFIHTILLRYNNSIIQIIYVCIIYSIHLYSNKICRSNYQMIVRSHMDYIYIVGLCA